MFDRSIAAAVLVLGLISANVSAQAPQENKDQKPEVAQVHRAISLSADARRDIFQRAIAHPGIAQGNRGRRLAGIRASAASRTDESGVTKTIFTVVLFDHTALEARRVQIDADTNELLANDRLPGRPQRSPEEFDEAVSIIRGDPELARFLDQGAILDGGFIVDDPAGSRRRIIQLKLLSPDRLTLLRSINVDLTRRVIASSDR